MASILALMLRSKFPALKCFAYEVPGCIFDEDLCKQTEEFIVSFVRNDDLGVCSTTFIYGDITSISN